MFELVTGLVSIIFLICTFIALFAIYTNVKQDLAHHEQGNAVVSFVSGVTITGSFALIAYFLWLL